MKHQISSKYFINLVRVGLIAVTTGITSEVAPAKADVIYHAFDECFADVKTKLPKIQKAGYTHIQISPANKTAPRSDNACTSDKEWYMQYQPLDYVLEGHLGTQKELKDLIGAAHKSGMKVIADVVLNHMAKYKFYETVAPFPQAYPIYQKLEYFHEAKCIDNYDDPIQVENRWLCDQNSIKEGLPDLRTDLPYVQQNAQKYMTTLFGLGIDGLRFDAAKHIPRGDMAKILSVVPKDKFFYGEVIGQSYDESRKYISVFPKVTDFQLVNTLKDAFKYGGDLRSLVNPSDTKRALPGNEAVTFSRNHDTWAPGQFDNWKFDSGDLPLATAYVLAIKEGTPLILNFDAFNPTVVAGVQFHQKLLTQPQYFRNGNEIATGANSPNLLFIERGDRGLAIINKSGEKFNVPQAKIPGLAAGCYNELQYKFQICVDTAKQVNRWGSAQRRGIEIGPRTALFFVRSDTN